MTDTDYHPATKALILFVAGTICGAVAFGFARVLVAVATWVWESFGWWSVVMVLLGVAWVGHAEKRRAK